jgi:RNA polymerase sigma-70 factor (sigma-E family)
MSAPIPVASAVVAGDWLGDTAGDVTGDMADGASDDSTYAAIGTLSFEQFYADAYAPMLRLAVALLPTKSLAEDVVQDAFAKALRKYASIDQPGAYVRRAIVNEATGFFRKRAVASAKEPLLRAATEVEHIDHDVMLRVLDTLPSRQRAALILRYYEQCSEAEIASILRCRPGTVKSLLSRGIAALREVISND